MTHKRRIYFCGFIFSIIALSCIHKESAYSAEINPFPGSDTASIQESVTVNKNMIEKEILLVLKRRCDAMVNKDIEALDLLMDDDIVLRHITGAVQTKQEWLQDIKNGRMNYHSIMIENLVFDVQEDTATVKYTSVIEATIYGSRGTWRLNNESHFEKAGDIWIWVTSPSRKEIDFDSSIIKKAFFDRRKNL